MLIMIEIDRTENLTGITIKGDFNDFDQLVDALYEITIDEENEKHQRYFNISTRLLGLSYEIRHAFQGGRDITLEPNGITDSTLKNHSIIAPKNNVYYSCNYLLPEMLVAILTINDLINLRMRLIEKPKGNYNISENKMVIWDPTINTLRNFQSAFYTCMKEVLTPTVFTRWLGIMNKRYHDMCNIEGYYIDLLNIKYLKMSPEIRKNKITNISKRLHEYNFDNDHTNIEETIRVGAIELGCRKDQISLEGFEYPDEIEW